MQILHCEVESQTRIPVFDICINNMNYWEIYKMYKKAPMIYLSREMVVNRNGRLRHNTYPVTFSYVFTTFTFVL